MHLSSSVWNNKLNTQRSNRLVHPNVNHLSGVYTVSDPLCCAFPAVASCPIGCKRGTATQSQSSVTWRWGWVPRASTWSLKTGVWPTLSSYGTVRAANASLASWQVHDMTVLEFGPIQSNIGIGCLYWYNPLFGYQTWDTDPHTSPD